MNLSRRAADALFALVAMALFAACVFLVLGGWR
jgi:hypothetical protein